jgi:hypothetical protein
MSASFRKQKPAIAVFKMNRSGCLIWWLQCSGESQGSPTEISFSLHYALMKGLCKYSPKQQLIGVVKELFDL